MTAHFIDTYFYGVPANALNVSGTVFFSRVTFNTGTGDVSGLNAIALTVASGGVVHLRDSTLRSFNSGVWIANSGTVYDDGGNTYTAVSGSGGFTTQAPVGAVKPVAFSLLPTCSATFAGYRNMITDSSTTTWGATITGGSSSAVQGLCNGTNWTVLGK